MTRMRAQGGRLIVLALAGLVLAVLVPAGPGQAELGRSSGSVAADQLRLHAALRRIDLATHVRHELALPNGGAVQEFSNPQGEVFAVRWTGPGKPDLRSLLGDHFAAFQAANSGQAGRFGRMSRQPLRVDTPPLRVEAGGHMGYFWGLAWLPALMPPGVQPGDLH